GAETTAHDDPFGVFPVLGLEVAADDESQLLREILDRALHDSAGFRVALGEEVVEGLFRKLVARLLAEWVVPHSAQWLAPVFDALPERHFAGAVANEAFVVLDLDIVAVDLDGRQARSTMFDNGWQRGGVGHEF